ncbi:MAG: nucleotide exchange factor GrpE [Clostridia bacterium]|nr:nucleotide exchange factor GrpE [Clostridia bacterium]MBQ9038000.1 nucleotide exchange factor GrpE [Clostridia bacterium]
MKKKDKDKTTPVEPEIKEAEAMEGEVSEASEAQAEHVATAEEWQAALELAVKQRDEFKDSLLRAQADFQNFKRRNQTARSDGYEDGVREAIAAMLPAIDNLERAIDAAEKTEDEAAKALADGVKMTLNTLTESLKRFGFEEVPALGEEFDPEKHNAVMREAGEEPGKVLEVFQKGYKVKDKIIRYAMVKVAVEE